MLSPLLFSFLLVAKISNVTLLHVGCHCCEEMIAYEKIGISSDHITWIDAQDDKVRACQNKNVSNVIHAVLHSHVSNQIFHCATNSESSSLKAFAHHKLAFPHVSIQFRKKVRTTTLDRVLFNRTVPNIWVLRVQGSELDVLLGSARSLRFADVILTKYDTTLYRNGATLNALTHFLLSHSFELYSNTLPQFGWGEALFVRHQYG